MPDLKDLKPSNLWKHFSNLCSIPRPSEHEQLAVRYVQETAQGFGLPVQADALGNVLIRKRATPGKEHSPVVVLQSHLDMVPQKNAGTIHDFERDPIQTFIDGDWVRARGTTLGADNGIGAAAMLAILEHNDLVHGTIEALFTVEEETGMTGALNLSPEMLKGKMLINLDTEEEGELYIGCAGGIDASAVLMYPQEPVGTGRTALKISISGLRGGHSGIDIHLGRANAIKLLNRVIFTSIEQFDIRICGYNGGSARNAIPREAFATIVIPSAYKDAFFQFMQSMQRTVQYELSGADPDVKINVSEIEMPERVMTGPAQDNLIRAIYACPNGVIRMSDQVPGVVETSNNLGILTCKEGRSEILCLLRSAIESAREDLGNAVLSALSLAEAHVEFSGAYPGWQPNPSSELLHLMQSVYEEMNGKKAAVKVVHAGLECGVIGAKYPGIDMVSCGPTISHPHSPDECVSIGSVERFWNYLIRVLERI